ncbi:hypothetical protein S7711_11062 [Stachybotrys chartarum IBT 7711]|uniref:Uncharacterized protein n=1 Tax=Stachybotrys chartarum (strain CBS 109288 / IBT 7711) TaxID=1280523 RepID=A0A084BB21_STACB|nr:hypothetical protein S7711_11062 [Stachybotrys chartarum IBT 7711]
MAQEPYPLIYMSSQLLSTECEYHITVEGSLSELQRFRAASVELQPMLRINTHYSSTKMLGIPQGGVATARGPVQLYEDSVVLATHTASNLRWICTSEQADVARNSEIETASRLPVPKVTLTLPLCRQEALVRFNNSQVSAEEEVKSWHEPSSIHLSKALIARLPDTSSQISELQLETAGHCLSLLRQKLRTKKNIVLITSAGISVNIGSSS